MLINLALARDRRDGGLVHLFDIAAVHVMLGARRDDAAERENRDTVGDGHEGVGDVGNVPDEVAATDAAPEHEDEEHNLIGADALVAKQVHDRAVCPR